MLSRVAGSLYWLGRYVERAENVTRLLQVTSQVAVEFGGLDDKLAISEWEDFARLLATDPLEAARPDGPVVAHTEEFLLNADNPLSVHGSLARARDNARAVREALTHEVFLNLNAAYRGLDERRRTGIADAVAAGDAVADTHRAILTALGSMENTLNRDQGWTFLKLGEAIERTQRTLSVLSAKLPSLRGANEDGGLPLLFARRRGLLRSVASLENFRRVHSGGLDANAVARFLLFQPDAPRSVRCGATRMSNYLQQLPSPRGMGAAARIAGRLLATLSYEDDHIMSAPDLAGFCDDAIDALAKLHEAIGRQYFPN
jgi:uncharacterized alpha-E superfamily protein